MIDTRRRLLTEALGEKWHKITTCLEDDSFFSTCICGDKWRIDTGIDARHRNRTFAEPSDYEALRVAVIVPHKQAFLSFLYRSCGYRSDKVIAVYESLLRWWFGLTPEERCEAICEFGIIELGWAIIEQEGKDGAKR